MERFLPTGDLAHKRRRHPADALAQFGKMGKRLASAINYAAAVGPKVARGDPQKRGLARTIGAENRPVLARPYLPIDGIENLFAAR
jgi:hypothetical protein